MKQKTQIWCGAIKHNGNGIKYEYFRYAGTPTEETHGDIYLACVGPFYTAAGGRFFEAYASGNPHCLCVADAERLARHEKTA